MLRHMPATVPEIIKMFYNCGGERERQTFVFCRLLGVSPEYENENEYVCDIQSVTGTGPSHKYTGEQEDCDAEHQLTLNNYRAGYVI